MPPYKYKTGSKSWLISPEKRLWAALFDDRKLREEINEMVKDGAKINAIKALKLYAEENFLGCSLREIKNVIDKIGFDRFAIRFSNSTVKMSANSVEYEPRLVASKNVSLKSIPCPEQENKVLNCVSCALCWNKNFDRVLFYTH